MPSLLAGLPALGAAVLLLGAASTDRPRVHPNQDPVAPDSFLVRFETTRGPFTIKARRAWSPHGVDRLYHLARIGFHNGAVFYRVGRTMSYPGGMVVQFGYADDAAANRAWATKGIPDEPVRTPHRRGTVMFARGGPNTRSVEIAIDLTPNSGLDTVHYQGVVGFPPLAEVVDGWSALDSLNRRHGNAPMEHMDSIMAGGRQWLDRKYPGLDRILRVSIPTEWPSGRPPRGQR